MGAFPAFNSRSSVSGRGSSAGGPPPHGFAALPCVCFRRFGAAAPGQRAQVSDTTADDLSPANPPLRIIAQLTVIPPPNLAST